MKNLNDLRPEHIKNKLGEKNKIALIGSHPIIRAFRDEKVMVMACNIRIKHAIPGIMRAAEELDAIVAFELARNEGNPSGGYTGQTPQIFWDTIIGYADHLNFTKPFFIHGDHITVRDLSEEEFGIAWELIKSELTAGYTSFAIDASFNDLPDNIRITTALARHLSDLELGLEVEVGEIKSAGLEAEITTVEESMTFIRSLKSNGINPDLLAINNGSKHGNYKPGEKVNIELKRTGEIFQAIYSFGVNIAQHGITGTPLHLMGQFTEYGIRKGNVGTLWQNLAHRHLPEDLMTEMRKWAADNGKDIKEATKPFKSQIDSIPASNAQAIADAAYQEACQHIQAFRAVGTASLLKQKLDLG
jgi:fructose-bisphosphate aldolase, class II